MTRKISLLIVDDEESLRDSLCDWFTGEGFDVDCAENAGKALQKLDERNFDIILTDIRMPGMDGIGLNRRIKEINKDSIVIIMTAYASVETAVQALKDGAYDYVTKPIDPDDLTHLIRNATSQINLKTENEILRNRVSTLENIGDIVGTSEAMVQVLRQVENVARTNSSVVITGESGTGKELVARAIHANSARRNYPMVTVHCGALTENLLESELFGHEKGAFTGATHSHRGRFELADGGTIFLDEISTVSPRMQVDLLRVLETKSFVRVGGSKEIKSDFRVICATNRDLKKLVDSGSFRADLYYRLNVVNIFIPPLRERPEDIPLLAEHFMKKYCLSMSRNNSGIDASAIRRIQEYHFPGNVRELANMIERAIVVGGGNKITTDDLPFCAENSSGGYESLEDMEKKHVGEVLEKYKWNISQSARALKVDRVTLYNKIRKHGLKQKNEK
ncbi:MAG: sigma-54-dependent transcriptional regulator [Bacteroidales bacterium]